MPNRPSGTGMLSTEVRKKITIIPKIAQHMLRGIGGTIFIIAAAQQIKTHILTNHQESHGWIELGVEVAPFAFATVLSFVMIAQPAAFATWCLETMGKLAARVMALIPKKGGGSGA